ncbi:metalloproteinase inhibitor 1-like [Saccostrea cucullata]|uniref:metalloproteinase inhibitor 1-like n=1 Tax=Saccostrea cuccullata TaxID=36930 RepID=UPI002ED53B37
MVHSVMLGILLLLGLTKSAFCCSCYMPRFQNSFCNGGFAITANVTSAELYFRDGRSLDSYVRESIIPNRMDRQEYNYSIDILEIFKRSESFEVADKDYVTSDAFDGSCGIELTVGTVYYMTGYIRNNHMVVSSCFTTVPFSELKEGQLAGIRGLYSANCKCRVNEMLLGRWKRKRVCHAEWYSPCEEQQAVCVKRKGGKCTWRFLERKPCPLDK